jgi:hypothetical protein
VKRTLAAVSGHVESGILKWGFPIRNKSLKTKLVTLVLFMIAKV